jgi:chemotaxis protein MotB
MNSDLQTIIIRKKKARHHGHHGGAWKVAYADFVTAMMALFIVLWLLNTSEEVKQAISGYFSAGSGQGKLTGSGVGGAGEGLALSKADMEKLKERTGSTVRSMPHFQELKNNVAMTVTGEGLRLELLENETGMFFETGNAKPTTPANELLSELAEELGKLQNSVVIEGHTDGRPFSRPGSYDNWELSVDRANAARRMMQSMGVRAGQIKQIRGYADQHLRIPDDPSNAANRRISVIVQYHPQSIPPTVPGK